MGFDVVIRGGTVVDGTGAEPVAADVAIDGDRIVAVGDVDGDGARDDRRRRPARHARLRRHPHPPRRAARVGSRSATSSCWHGVTSVVLGNCGVTFAPVQARRPRVPRRDDGVGRGHPRRAHPRRPRRGTGRPTASTSARSTACPRASTSAAWSATARCATTRWASAASTRRPRPTTTSRRCASSSTRRCDAGALGFSTSRTLLHRVPDGRPVPGHVGRRPTSCSRSATCSAGTDAACSRRPPRSASATATDSPNTRAEVALDGRDQPPHRPAGHVRPRAVELAGPSCTARVIEFVEGGERARRRGAPADHGARHRPPVRPRQPHAVRPGVQRGRRSASCRSPNASPRCAIRRAAPSSSTRPRPRHRRSTGASCTCLPTGRAALRPAPPRTRSPRTRRRAA